MTPHYEPVVAAYNSGKQPTEIARAMGLSVHQVRSAIAFGRRNGVIKRNVAIAPPSADPRNVRTYEAYATPGCSTSEQQAGRVNRISLAREPWHSLTGG